MLIRNISWFFNTWWSAQNRWISNKIKSGVACIYYKLSLLVRLISLPYLKEALLLETHKISNFEKRLSDTSKRKPSSSVITGDFNARSSASWPKDINTKEGSKFFAPSSSNGFPQLIKEPTHIKTSSSSCIDLIFTDQPNYP